MRFLSNSEEILQAIQDIRPSRLAVAYIGRDFDQFIDPGWIEQIVLSPTRGSNPHAIKQLVEEIKWDRIQFIPELHAKIYLGRESAVVGSANLSRNGLDVGGLWEAGMFVDEQEVLDDISSVVDQMIDQARLAYPTIKSKEEALAELLETWKPGTFPPRKTPRPIPENPGDSTLEEILATVGVIPEYHSRPEGIYNEFAQTPLGEATWKYLNAYQTIELMVDASDSRLPTVAGIDQQYHDLFQELRAASSEDDNRLKQMIGNMVRQVMERFGFQHDRQGVDIGGVFFENGSTYLRIIRHRRRRLILRDYGIDPGSTLVLKNFPHIQATVVANNKVEFQGIVYSLSGAAKEAIRLSGREPNEGVAGSYYWKFDNELLDMRRKRLDNEQE